VIYLLYFVIKLKSFGILLFEHIFDLFNGTIPLQVPFFIYLSTFIILFIINWYLRHGDVCVKILLIMQRSNLIRCCIHWSRSLLLNLGVCSLFCYIWWFYSSLWLFLQLYPLATLIINLPRSSNLQQITRCRLRHDECRLF